MGTFIIKPTSLVSGGTPLFDTNVAVFAPVAGWLLDFTKNTTILSAILAPTPSVAGTANCASAVLSDISGSGSFSGTLRFGCSGNSIYLDGSTIPTDFNHLPAGFIAQSAVVRVDNFLVSQPVVGNVQSFLQHSSGDNGIINTDNYPYNFAIFPKPLMLDIVNNGMGFNVNIVINDANDAGSVIFSSLRIEGTYTIQSSQYTIQNTVPVNTGDKVKITAASQLDGVAQIQLTFTDTNGPQTIIVPPWNIILQQPTQLWFYVPYGFFSFPIDQTPKIVTITLVGNGIQFSGSVFAGGITVLFADASGLYVLTKNQTNDVLYFRAGYTVSLALPIITDILFMEQNEIYETDLFDLMGYPQKILAQNYLDDDYDYDDDAENMFLIMSSQINVITQNVEIPSPFIETSFIP